MIQWFIKLSIGAVLSFFFFFFQAEDGIRDLTVTGVQTCALPISPLPQKCFELSHAALVETHHVVAIHGWPADAFAEIEPAVVDDFAGQLDPFMCGALPAQLLESGPDGAELLERAAIALDTDFMRYFVFFGAFAQLVLLAVQYFREEVFPALQ